MTLGKKFWELLGFGFTIGAGAAAIMKGRAESKDRDALISKQINASVTRAVGSALGTSNDESNDTTETSN